MGVHVTCKGAVYVAVGVTGREDNTSFPCLGNSVDSGNIHRNNKDAGRLAASVS